MEIGKLNEWNPWWENKELIEELRGQARPTYNLLVNSVNLREVTIITGVRRSGKSTLMYQMVYDLLKKGLDPKQILFVNLEDVALADNPLDEIYNSYRENVNLDKKAYIFLDEIHRRARWESWIRKKHDLKTKDKFVISGSCSYLLKKEYSALLTGRNLMFEIFPLSYKEFLLFKGIGINENNIKKGILLDKTRLAILKNLKEYIVLGGFPQLIFTQEEYKTKLLKQYFDDILYKDIVDRYDLDVQKAKDLALFLITNFTSLISLRSLRNTLKISYDTVKDYVSYYTEAFLFFTLDYFSYSLNEQKTRPSKIYCIDNGLRNAVSFKFSKDEGKLAENLVFLELKRRDCDIYYWKNKAEVDFIIKDIDKLTAINVTFSSEINKREVKSLLEFKGSFKKQAKKPIKLITITKDLEIRSDGISFVPLWKWLLLAPRQGMAQNSRFPLHLPLC
ncbi:hypothetical protein COT48_05195 [Candidatus Woesearchaeota archaeon CG08_land_8_20_14_0_20_47_9]|nr:MAG: hypothetical protein AUJ69_01255 [Candidatus Woesearchaeota archaeon CG1_02_47_18]PIO03366.1 MAG: hypothetical protein COT48_05195 [Candidatus Woesearchaeota archaeon CG08_land_8_20_14_0_20_47_9]HII30224.1 ATP-binding protein [Candidatus Woesearchaeota archaeon]